MTWGSRKLRWCVALFISIFLLSGCDRRNSEKSDKFNSALEKFKAHCLSSGIRINRRVENVDGFYLLKLRPENINFDDQFLLDDPYGRDLTGEDYIASLLRGQFWHSHVVTRQTAPDYRIGYKFLDAVDPKDGVRYRYTGKVVAVRQQDLSSPMVKLAIERDKNYDTNIYEFKVFKVPAPQELPLYGLTFDDISTSEDRKNWIAGSSLRVIDISTGAVMAERIGFMFDHRQGDRSVGRSPWLFAADNACPKFIGKPGFIAQPYQTLDLVQQVLSPST